MKNFISGIICIAVLFISACSPVVETKEIKEFDKKKENINSLMTKQTSPKVEFSMDRYILGERLIRFNDPNKMTYLYLFLPGNMTLKMTIMGKLTSTTKRLTQPEQICVQRDPLYAMRTDVTHTNDVCEFDKFNGSAPDEMGTYGSSEPAKVGMTTVGSLIETGGFMAYIYSEMPLNFKNLNTPMVEFDVQVTPEEKAQLTQQLKDSMKGNLK